MTPSYASLSCRHNMWYAFILRVYFMPTPSLLTLYEIFYTVTYLLCICWHLLHFYSIFIDTFTRYVDTHNSTPIFGDTLHWIQIQFKIVYFQHNTYSHKSTLSLLTLYMRCFDTVTCLVHLCWHFTWYVDTFTILLHLCWHFNNMLTLSQFSPSLLTHYKICIDTIIGLLHCCWHFAWVVLTLSHVFSIFVDTTHFTWYVFTLSHVYSIVVDSLDQICWHFHRSARPFLTLYMTYVDIVTSLLTLYISYVDTFTGILGLCWHFTWHMLTLSHLCWHFTWYVDTFTGLLTLFWHFTWHMLTLSHLCWHFT